MWQRYWTAMMTVTAMLLCGCDAPAADAGRNGAATQSSAVPTIIVDSRHQLRDRGDAGRPYLVSAAPGIVLDATRFSLRDPDRRARMANTVRIIYENSIFRATWPQSGRQAYPLDRSTLTRVLGKEFEGFKSGTQGYIAIGYQEGGPTDQGEFVPFWMTSVIFR